MEDRGLEPAADSPGKLPNSDLDDAQFDAVGAAAIASDIELRALVEAWPTLSTALKAAVLAIIKAATG